MHYYKRNLGDYAKKAGRLTMLQHGAYTLLIDACYDREQFPTLEEAIDWAWASSSAEIEAVEFVLRKFFTLEDGRYVQNRIQEEIEAYRAVSETNARIARERETKRAEKSTKRERSVNDASRGGNEAPPNQEPLTINQEPKEEETPRKRSATPAVAKPDEVAEQTWADWLQLRKAKRAPVNETTLSEAKKEAGKAGLSLDAFLRIWCVRGSQGLMASWINADERSAYETPYQRSMRERMAEAAPEFARKSPGQPAENAADFFNAIDVTSRTVERLT